MPNKDSSQQQLLSGSCQLSDNQPPDQNSNSTNNSAGNSPSTTTDYDDELQNYIQINQELDTLDKLYKESQEEQKQLLLKTFQKREAQLDIIHKLELKAIEQQQLQKNQQQQPQCQPSSIKNALPINSSAIGFTKPGSIMKQKLQQYLMNKNQNSELIKSMPRSVNSPPVITINHSLRKSASEPSLMKKLKQNVIDRMARNTNKKRNQKLPYMVTSRPNPHQLQHVFEGNINPILAHSPSMPNISLGLPHLVSLQRKAVLEPSATELPQHADVLNITTSVSIQLDHSMITQSGLVKANADHININCQNVFLMSNVMMNAEPIVIEDNADVDDSIGTVIDLSDDDSTPIPTDDQYSLPTIHETRCSDQTHRLPQILQAVFSKNHCQDTEKLLAVDLSPQNQRNPIGFSKTHEFSTGLAFDNTMLHHSCICGNDTAHPEHNERLIRIWYRLIEAGVTARCYRIQSRMATQAEIQTVHTESYAMFFGSSQMEHSTRNGQNNLVRMTCGGVGADPDTIWNERYTASAARMAVGCVVELALKIVQGFLKNGFAVVRPPGHHAEPNVAMGFCFFNSIAIAARILRRMHADRVKRILIVDWDIHHGNGTEQIFYEDPHVLVISVHRYDGGNFFPGTGDSSKCGAAAGRGFNVNVSWSGGIEPPYGDAEYLAAFRTVVMPISREFRPDIVLVSAGFDAASGHTSNLGGYEVSPACFGHMTRELLTLSNGKLIMALEGGYELLAISESVTECVKALLGDETTALVDAELQRTPIQNAIDTLTKTIDLQMPYWPCLKRFAKTVAMSVEQSKKVEMEEMDTAIAMASLSTRFPTPISPLWNNEAMDQDEVN